MNKQKRVSVIIPNYNYEKYIELAVGSVVASDFDRDQLEIVIIDDASTDNSIGRINSLIKDSRIGIRLIRNATNLGLIRSRNIGIDEANGEFLFFLDPDNYIGKDCLKKHSEALIEDPDATACYAPVQRFDNETGEFLSLTSNELFDYHKLAQGNYIDAMAMFRKSDLVEAGMYDVRMPPYGWEDYELWLRLASMKKKVHFIQGEPLSFYRAHRQSMLVTTNDNAFNLLKMYLNIKYNLDLEMVMTPDLERILKPERKYFSQITPFVQGSLTSGNNQTTLETVTVNIGQHISGKVQHLQFRFSRGIEFSGFLFSPLNGMAAIRLGECRFYHEGKEFARPLKLQSNALNWDDGYYLFDIEKPEIRFEFANNAKAMADEISIEVIYISKGNSNFKLVNDYYRTTMNKFENQIFNTSLLKQKIKKLLKR